MKNGRTKEGVWKDGKRDRWLENKVKIKSDSPKSVYKVQIETEENCDRNGTNM